MAGGVQRGRRSGSRLSPEGSGEPQRARGKSAEVRGTRGCRMEGRSEGLGNRHVAGGWKPGSGQPRCAGRKCRVEEVALDTERGYNGQSCLKSVLMIKITRVLESRAILKHLK